MFGPSRARTDHLAVLRHRANCERMRIVSGDLKIRFLLSSEVFEVSNYSGSAVVPDLELTQVPGFTWTKIRKADGASGSYRYALPRISSSTYTLAYRVCFHRPCGHRGTSPVKLTSHFPEAKTPTTLAFDVRLTVSAARRRSFKDVGPPCFTESRWLALRRGRIVLPPQVLSPGSFTTTF
jgi:hypothetical protein